MNEALSNLFTTQPLYRAKFVAKKKNSDLTLTGRILNSLAKGGWVSIDEITEEFYEGRKKVADAVNRLLVQGKIQKSTRVGAIKFYRITQELIA